MRTLVVLVLVSIAGPVYAQNYRCLFTSPHGECMVEQYIEAPYYNRYNNYYDNYYYNDYYDNYYYDNNDRYNCNRYDRYDRYYDDYQSDFDFDRYFDDRRYRY